MMNSTPLDSSFRDPSGFVFQYDNTIYRGVASSYKVQYDMLMSSGLYERLVKDKLLIPHEETALEIPLTQACYKTLKPVDIPFISYPYEWSFSQLKDAALLTLDIQKRAIEYGMTLKDGSAYNIQFLAGKPIFIDTLSFDVYEEGSPWIAYKQFCQHFLAPLALMAHSDIRLSQLSSSFIDGIPLNLAKTILPNKTKLNFGLLAHIHLHASSQEHYSDKAVKKSAKVSKNGLLGIVDSLASTVKKLKWAAVGTEWFDYYDKTNYDDLAMENKAQIVEKFLDNVNPGQVWDLGANTGRFSRIAEKKEIPTVSFDIDPAAVEKNYLYNRKKKGTLLPLVQDLINPSPAIGWANKERMSLIERGSTDVAMALALIHHLAISNNVPFLKIADFFQSISEWLIIEFVPKDDSQVQLLLRTRKDIFPNYDEKSFKEAFGHYFEIEQEMSVEHSKRTIYLMKKRGH